MAIKPVKFSNLKRNPSELIGEIVDNLKKDEGIPLGDLAEELDLPIHIVRTHTKKMKAYIVFYDAGRPVAYAANPKHLEK